MYKIQTNQSGTRNIEVSEDNLITLEKYNLLQDLVDSNGIISIINSQDVPEKELINLCIDVIYHNNMKAFGLHQLIMLYINWKDSKEKTGTEQF